MSIRAIHRLLIANRSEIARRIQRTARAMGIQTVAVFSDADAELPFVREADVAVRIGPPPAAESYNNIGRIIDAARRTGADAIHPGFGFLAENADFAQAVIDAGLIWVGPPADAIRKMGSKREAKRIAAEAGVPVIEGFDGDISAMAERASQIGYPVLLKASAGGGGKGMKRVDRPEDFDDALASAQREARSAFGDDSMILEKYIASPRHIEIQIFGDSHGNLAHLFERECSIQRRHQKVIEECPSPVVNEELRHKMGRAATDLAAAIGYQSAGTVEMMYSAGEFYFLEVNTRLQVEHPVTEMVTGLDLVREQLRVAEGHRLSFETPAMVGAAVEVRLYAEDPAAGHLPQSGVLTDWHHEPAEGVRLDDGVESGTEVSIHYDPMLAKVIAHGCDRQEAISRLRTALWRMSVQGVATNRELLLDILDHPAFVAGELDTHFLDTHFEGWAPVEDDLSQRRALIGATLAAHEARSRGAEMPSLPSGFRNNSGTSQRVSYRFAGDTLQLLYRHQHRKPGTFRLEVSGETHEARVLGWEPPILRFELDSIQWTMRVIRRGDRVFTHCDGTSSSFQQLPRYPTLEVDLPPGACVAPMPGKVVKLEVQVGDEVTARQPILILEAMKMEQRLLAPAAGTVEAVHVAEGDQVEAEAVLVLIS